MNKLLDKILLRTSNLDYISQSIKNLTENTPARKIFNAINNHSDTSEIRYVGGCVRKIINKEEIDDIVVSEVATMASPALLESETNYTLGENDNGQTMLTVETHAPLDEEESDLIAEDVANKLFDLGYDNFDIEVSV